MIFRIRNLYFQFKNIWVNLLRLNRSIDDIQINIAKSYFLSETFINNETLDNAGYKVFSQWDEDGIIQWIVNNTEIKNKNFIEFGVEDYHESNTRFLLINNFWKGLVIDSSKNNIIKIKNSYYSWRGGLKSKCSFITTDNVNDILKTSGFDKDIGLLSIDIDGMDYHILESINYYEPRILICEFNPIFSNDKDRKIVVPYKKNFDRSKAHYSNNYYGCSLKALIDLAKSKNYIFIGLNSGNNNAFFLRNDVFKNSNIKECKDYNINSPFVESRNQEGKILEECFDMKKFNLKVLNVDTKLEELL